MNVSYPDDARQWGDAYALTQEATKRLAEILGPSAGAVRVQWDRVADEKGRPLYRLALADFTGQVSTAFTREELMNPIHMHVRLYRLWGDLLQVRSDEQHRVVEAISGQINGGHGGD